MDNIFFLLSKYIGVEFLLTFWETASFPKWLYHIMSSPTIYESLGCSTCLSVLVWCHQSFLVTWNGCNCSAVSCGLVCIFLLTNDVEYLFLSVLTPRLYSFVRNLLKSVADTFSKIMIIKLATIISPITHVSHTMHYWHSATRHVCHFILKTGET